MTKIAQYLGILLVTLGACKKDETVAAYGAADQIWQVVEVDGIAFPATASLTFPQTGIVSGSAPCNQFSAELQTPYPWFELSAIKMTKRACPDLAAETTFIEALADMTLVEVLEDTMILSTPEGRSILFKSAAKTPQ
ncbi:MAG: META domain-containing protein [Roseobacter sp.]